MGSTEQLPKMQYRFLGRSGLQVSVISLGGWVTYGGHVGDQLAFDCMKAAYDAGINFFDCAEAYAGGKSEVVMGQAIKKYGWKRNDLVISTKINWVCRCHPFPLSDHFCLHCNRAALSGTTLSTMEVSRESI